MQQSVWAVDVAQSPLHARRGGAPQRERLGNAGREWDVSRSLLHQRRGSWQVLGKYTNYLLVLLMPSPFLRDCLADRPLESQAWARPSSTISCR